MHETTTTHARNKTKHRPYLQPRKEGQTQHAEEEPATTAGICKKPYENTRKKYKPKRIFLETLVGYCEASKTRTLDNFTEVRKQ